MANEDGCNVKRIALCSALCAGFAYVGYNVVSKIFHKKITNDENDSKTNVLGDKCVSRYLSKSIQTDAAMIAGDYFDSSKSVRERVKDFNVIAKQFPITNIPLSPETRPLHSLKSPWSSPLGCAKYLSFSAENISTTSPLSSPEHKRRTKTPSIPNNECAPGFREPFRYNISSRVSITQDPVITMKTLNNLQKSPRKMTLFETKSILSLLHSVNEDILVKTLSTISNCAAFTSNQEQLCDAGCPEQLKDLLQHQSDPVKVATVQAISNIAIIDKGHLYFKQHIPILINYALHGGELLKSLSLTALANLALNDATHKLMIENVSSILHLVENGSSVVQLQALRLLVNLSCNKDMIPFLLMSKVSPSLFDLIHIPSDREVTLRLLTFLANIITFAVQDLDITSGSSTLISILYRMRERTELSSIVQLSDDTDEDISFQAKRLHSTLVNKWC